MAVEMVLNDLSLSRPVDEQGMAIKLMSDLVAVLSSARNIGVKTLRTHGNLNYLELSPEYPISRWINDGRVDLDERRFFLTFATKTPLLEDIGDVTIPDRMSLAEFRHEGKPSETLGIAYLLNALVVSFCSEPKWNCDSLDLEIEKIEDGESIEEDESEELISVTSIEKLIHASKREHVLGHKTQIQNWLVAEPWHSQDELLPCYKANEINPFCEWLDSLGDRQAAEFIRARLNQVKQGSLGDWKSVGEGVHELRIFYGPGYRVYFGQAETQRILLCGGDKGSQSRDIEQAKQHWKDYRRR